MNLFCEYDRFELEQDIIKLWETNEAISELIRQHLDRPEGPFSDDEFANRLDGIKYVNELKLQRLWDGFEMMIKNKIIIVVRLSIEYSGDYLLLRIK